MEESTRACACASVRIARESTQARSPKWNSMTELEREKGNSDRKGEGNEMECGGGGRAGGGGDEGREIERGRRGKGERRRGGERGKCGVGNGREGDGGSKALLA